MCVPKYVDNKHALNWQVINIRRILFIIQRTSYLKFICCALSFFSFCFVFFFLFSHSFFAAAFFARSVSLAIAFVIAREYFSVFFVYILQCVFTFNFLLLAKQICAIVFQVSHYKILVWMYTYLDFAVLLLVLSSSSVWLFQLFFSSVCLFVCVYSYTANGLWLCFDNTDNLLNWPMNNRQLWTK